MVFIHVVTCCSQRHFVLGTFFLKKEGSIPSILFIHNLQAIFYIAKRYQQLSFKAPDLAEVNYTVHLVVNYSASVHTDGNSSSQRF